MMRMNAYYYSFQPTGVEDVDKILSAVARAGKAYHHTESWAVKCGYLGNKSHIDLIQEAANELAEKIKAARLQVIE